MEVKKSEMKEKKVVKSGKCIILRAHLEGYKINIQGF
jgi:hypothetical protein